jgi:hypothetical protein
MHKKHQQFFNQFSATFQQDTIISWQKVIDAWKRIIHNQIHIWNQVHVSWQYLCFIIKIA